MKKYILSLLLFFPYITHACWWVERWVIDYLPILVFIIIGVIICYLIAKLYYNIVKKTINLFKITETKFIIYSKWIVFILLSINYIRSLIVFLFSSIC